MVAINVSTSTLKILARLKLPCQLCWSLMRDICRLDCRRGFLMIVTSAILRKEINDVVYHLVRKPRNELISVFILPRFMSNSLDKVVPVHENHSYNGMVDTGVPFHCLREILKM